MPTPKPDPLEPYSRPFEQHAPAPWRWEGMLLYSRDQISPASSDEAKRANGDEIDVPILAVSCMHPGLRAFLSRLPEMCEAMLESEKGRAVLAAVQIEYAAELAKLRGAGESTHDPVDTDEGGRP